MSKASRLSVSKIKVKGDEIESTITKKFIKDLVRSTGRLYSEKKKYQLWSYPKESPIFFYVLMRDKGGRYKMIKRIESSEKKILEKSIEICKENKHLQYKIAGLRKQHKIKQKTSLTRYIA